MKYLNLILLLILVAACSSAENKPKNEARSVVLQEAYEYGFPLVLMDVTRQVSTNVSSPDSKKIRAPMNQFAHATQFPDANFKDIVRANVDTLYSMAWLDLSKEPMILEVPETNGRYYLMPMMDGWTNVYNSPGKRTTGTHKIKFVIVGPNWQGDLPVGPRVIRSPTEMTWILGRTQTNSQSDARNTVAKIQKGYKLYPLSALDKRYTPPKGQVDKAINMQAPVDQVFAMKTEDFFNRLNQLMLTNPPAINDQPALAKFSKHGIGPGAKFMVEAVNPRELRKINDIPDTVRAKLDTARSSMVKPVNGWVINRDVGTYGTNYSKRAIVAFAGLGANLDADALYPTAVMDGNGKKLNGNNNYVLHFTKEEIPAVKAFWSLTVYGADSFLVKNPINRYALGSRDKLQYNSDGSLDIYLQNQTPGKNMESNWLPTPKGEFDVTARMYWPKPEVTKPDWKLPPIMPATSRSTISDAD